MRVPRQVGRTRKIVQLRSSTSGFDASCTTATTTHGGTTQARREEANALPIGPPSTMNTSVSETNWMQLDTSP